MGAITDLWKSERGLLAVLIIIAASTFVAIGKMTVGDWQTFVMVIFGTYAAGKTVTGAVSIIKGVPDPVPNTRAQAVPQPAALEPTVPVTEVKT